MRNNKKYKYLVSYHESNPLTNAARFGRCGVSRDNPITDIGDICDIEQDIRSRSKIHEGFILLVMNWKKFEAKQH